MREIQIVDNFLDDFEEFNDWARSQHYGGVVNPEDGVLYPDIVVALPDGLLDEVQKKVPEMANINYAFLRLTNSNTEGAPHQAHNDAVMGQYTFILYLQDGPGGTSVVRHKMAGLENGPESFIEQQIWERDTNVPQAWEVVGMVDMKANRATWYPSTVMHRAEPIGGFGKGVEDGRLVLTIFFDGE